MTSKILPCDQSGLKRQLKKWAFGVSRQRVLMVVGNRIEGDSRVIKSAVALQNNSFDVLLLGTTRLKTDFATAVIENIPVIFLNNKELKIELNVDEHIIAIGNIAKCASRVFLIYKPRMLYTHDFWGLDIGANIVRNHYYKNPCFWLHDVHEYVRGYQGVLPDQRLAYALSVERDSINIPDHLIIVNEAIRDLICEDYAINFNKTSILHNVPRKQEPIDGFNLRKNLGIKPDELLGVYVGRATKLRGLDVVIPALKAFPKLHFAFFSSAKKSYLDELKALAKQDHNDFRLHFFDYVHDTHVASAIQSADFGFSPLTRYGNTDLAIATKIYEYIHASLPMIVSDARLQARFIEDNQLGFIFSAATPDDSIIPAIQALISRAKNGFSVDWCGLQERYSWEVQFQAIIDIGLQICQPNVLQISTSRGIFQGPGPSAGQPGTLAQALRRQGMPAEAITLAQSKFHYPYDIKWLAPNVPAKSSLALWAAHRYEVFHFHFSSFINMLGKDSYRLPTFIDLLLLKALRKTIVFHFRGSEIRVNAEFRQLNPFAWDESSDPTAHSMSDILKIELRNHIRELADTILVVDPELQTYVPEAQILPRAINIQHIHPTVETKNALPIIVHAPSRKAIKGTETIKYAIDEINKETKCCELVILENIPHAELLEHLASADIVIDQILIGWYGVLAVEAMALGKPVVAYIREDLWAIHHHIPIINANPLNLADKLRPLISSANLRRQLGKKARLFAEAVHADDLVARQAIRIYDQVSTQNKNQKVDHLFKFFIDQSLDYLKIEKLQETALTKTVQVYHASDANTLKQQPQSHVPGGVNDTNKAFLQTNNLMKEKKYNEAIVKSACISESLPFYLYHQRLGDEYINAQRFDEAKAAYARSLELNPVDFLLIARLADRIKTLPEASEWYPLIKNAIPHALEAKGRNKPVYELAHSSSLVNKKIMQAYLARHPLPSSKSLSASVSQQTKTLVLLTCVWQRPELTQIVLSYYQQVRLQLADQMNLVLLAVGSEAAASRMLCERWGFHYVEHDNTPLSDKWECGLKASRQFNPDGVVIMGSDDLVSASLFSRYIKLLDEGFLFCGLNDCFFLDLANPCQALHWKGYGGLSQERGMPWRLNETMGMGRMYSRLLLEWLDYSLWKDVHINKGLDIAAKERLYEFGMQPVFPHHAVSLTHQGFSYNFGQAAYRMRDMDICALDIKSPAGNVTKIMEYHNSSFSKVMDTWDFFARFFPEDTLKALKSLAVHYSA